MIKTIKSGFLIAVVVLIVVMATRPVQASTRNSAAIPSAIAGTPEPVSLLLVGSALIVIGVVMKKTQKKA